MFLKNKNIVSMAEVGSTNNYATQLVSDKAGEGTVVLAQYQSRGRGQAGSYWESKAGKNLLMSLILEPKFLEAGQQFFLSMAVSLALTEVLSNFLDDVAVKWPNDIYVGEKKIAGILIENSVKGGQLETAVIGIGLNVNQESFESDAPNPVSIKQLTGKDCPVESILHELLIALDKWYTQLSKGNLENIKQCYLSFLFRKNGWHRFRTANEEFEAHISGIGEYGQLLLEDREGKIRKFMFKEVEFVI